VATNELYAGRPCSPNRFGSRTSVYGVPQRAAASPSTSDAPALPIAYGVPLPTWIEFA